MQRQRQNHRQEAGIGTRILERAGQPEQAMVGFLQAIELQAAVSSFGYAPKEEANA